MKLKANKIRLQFSESGQAEVVITSTNTPNLRPEIAEMKEIISKGKELSVEIKQYREKRSLDANSYFWLLLSEIAVILKTTKDELYLIMLERYGIFTHIVVKPEMVNRVKEEWRTIRELGEVTINGKQGIQLQCFFGSSTYDSKEMASLIDGVISEAQEIGISTITPNELLQLKSAWGERKVS